jgi:hypothetical protein
MCSVLCTQCCYGFSNVHSWLPLWFSLTFNYLPFAMSGKYRRVISRGLTTMLDACLSLTYFRIDRMCRYSFVSLIPLKQSHVWRNLNRMEVTFHNSYVILELVPSTVIFWTDLSCWCKGYSNNAMLLLSGFLVGSALLICLEFYVVLLCVFTFWVPCCDVRYDFHIKTMSGSH